MTVHANLTFTVPVSVERNFAGRNVVQVSGPVVSSSSGAGFVGAGQLVPVPTGQAGTAAASAGVSAVVPVQPEFLAGRQSTEFGHLMPNRLIQQANTDGLVYTTTAPMVSAGVGASVGVRLPASTPVDMVGPGMAGLVPYTALSLVSGGHSTPAYNSAVPSVSGGAFPRAGFLESAGAHQGVPILARGTCPVNGSKVPAPPGAGVPAPGGSGVGTGTAKGSRVIESMNEHTRMLVRQRLAELGHLEEENPGRRYLPSLAISKVPLDGLIPASGRLVTRDLRTTSKTPFSRAYVNADFHGRPLACMLGTGCDQSVIGCRFVERYDLQPVQFSLMAAGRNSLKVDGEMLIQFSIDGYPMEAEVSVSPSIDELLLGCDWLTKHKGSGTSPRVSSNWETLRSKLDQSGRLRSPVEGWWSPKSSPYRRAMKPTFQCGWRPVKSPSQLLNGL